MKVSQALTTAATASSVTTTTAGVMTAAEVQPFVQWALDGFPHPVPQSVSLFVASASIVALHGAAKLFTAWLSARASRPDPAPAPKE